MTDLEIADSGHHETAEISATTTVLTVSELIKQGAEASADNPIVGEPKEECHVEGHASLALTDEIIELWRQRQSWHRAEKSLTLQSKAIFRRFTKGDKKEAEKLYKLATAATVSMPQGQYSVAAVAVAIAPLVEARDHIAKYRKAFEKRLEKLAEQLPVWNSWAKNVRGFGLLSLAGVIAETGGLDNYRYQTHSRLWKRMGLAVIDGGRQRRISGDAAIVHGFNPARCSVAWNIGRSFIKVGGSSSPYRALYDARKLLEAERVGSKTHAHNRAARYMVKRFLRDLWRASNNQRPALFPLPNSALKRVSAADIRPREVFNDEARV